MVKCFVGEDTEAQDFVPPLNLHRIELKERSSNTIPDMRIELLARHRETLPTLIQWYQCQWEPFYGPGGKGNAKHDLESRCNMDRLPLGLIAFKGDIPVGTAALAQDPSTMLTPSVVGLFVAPAFRRQGIGAALILETARLAKRLNYNRLYLSTMVLDSFLLRNGWRKIDTVHFLNDQSGSVYMCEI